jgi:hypothetical protein
MKDKLPLPFEKKLTVIFRLEEDCLGPDGIQSVDQFCQHAEDHVSTIDADFVHWVIQARHDASLTEMEYSINHKKLTHDQAAKYLLMFDKQLDDFEAHLHDSLTTLIDNYLSKSA